MFPSQSNNIFISKPILDQLCLHGMPWHKHDDDYVIEHVNNSENKYTHHTSIAQRLTNHK